MLRTNYCLVIETTSNMANKHPVNHIMKNLFQNRKDESSCSEVLVMR